MDFSCQSQVLAKPFPAKPDYDQGDVDAGGGACVGPAFLTARKACGNMPVVEVQTKCKKV